MCVFLFITLFDFICQIIMYVYCGYPYIVIPEKIEKCNSWKKRAKANFFYLVYSVAIYSQTDLQIKKKHVYEKYWNFSIWSISILFAMCY